MSTTTTTTTTIIIIIIIIIITLTIIDYPVTNNRFPIRHAQDLQKSRSNPSSAIWSNSRTEDPQISSTTVQNLVAVATGTQDLHTPALINYVHCRSCVVHLFFRFTGIECRKFVCLFVCFCRDSPQWTMASSVTKFLDHTQRRTTVSRTPLVEWSARRRDLYLTTHNTHNRQTCMLQVGFELTISTGEWPQTARPRGPAMKEVENTKLEWSLYQISWYSVNCF